MEAIRESFQNWRRDDRLLQADLSLPTSPRHYLSKFHSFLSITINSLITQQCQRRAWHNGRSPPRAGSSYR
jgi:hypothetical protein